MALHSLKHLRAGAHRVATQAASHLNSAVDTVRPAYEGFVRPVLGVTPYAHVAHKVDAGLAAYDRIRSSMGK